MPGMAAPPVASTGSRRSPSPIPSRSDAPRGFRADPQPYIRATIGSAGRDRPLSRAPDCHRFTREYASMTHRSSRPIADDVAPPNMSDAQRLAELESRLRQAEDALRLSNGQLQTALDLGKLGSWDCDLGTGQVNGTAAFKASLGLPPDASLTYDQWQRMIHPDDLGRVQEALSATLGAGSDF